jgi:hypothetical protein
MFYGDFQSTFDSTLAARFVAQFVPVGLPYQQSGKKLLKVRASRVGRGK